MVTCSQCQTRNPPEREACQKCGADLLPPPGTSKRMWGIIKAALAGLFIIAIGITPLILWRDIASVAVSQGFAVLLLLAGGVVGVRGLIRAIEPAPIHSRYLERAARHVEIDSAQAMTDFVHGVMLAPAKVRQNISQSLPTKLKNLVVFSEKSLVSATSGYQSPEGVRKIIYASYTIWGRLSETMPEFRKSSSTNWQAGVESSKAHIRRKKTLAELSRVFNDLAGAGLVKKLGYCPKCRVVVTCDESGHCSCDGKHGQAKGIVYVIPEEEQLFKKRLMQAYAS